MRFEEIAVKYRNRTRMLCIYTEEAHPSDGVQHGKNIEEGIQFKEPTNLNERAENARACLQRYNFSFPMALDSMKNETESNYVTMAIRLYIIDGLGRIAYRGGLGPRYLDVDEFETSLATLVGT